VAGSGSVTCSHGEILEERGDQEEGQESHGDGEKLHRLLFSISVRVMVKMQHCTRRLSRLCV
jgi:hypothetical protein